MTTLTPTNCPTGAIRTSDESPCWKPERTRPGLLWSLLFSVILLASGLASQAQEVSCGLSSNESGVGEPVQIVVTVRGARGADIPQSLSVNGLRITLVGRSTQFEMNNFKLTSTITYTYMVVPQLEGDFTIPPFDVRIDKKVFRTEPMKLAVRGGGMPVNPSQLPAPGFSGPPTGVQPQTSRGNPSSGKPFFAELLLAKKKAYVGEIIPAELRFYFNARYGGQVNNVPVFSGEGFTIQKFSNPEKREQVIDGERYVVFAFKTAITPVKFGTLQVPPAKLEAQLQIPSRGGQQDFFANFSGMFAETRPVSNETKPEQIDALPLPKDGRPEDFSGAVGRFTMEATVSPKKAGRGEPVTLKATISGQGNLDALGAPALTGDDGWKTYPPTDKIQSSDSTGYTGEKEFEYQLVAREDQHQTPGLTFSYFDPTDRKYVTLTQAPLPVLAKAGTPDSSSTATVASAATGKPASPSGTPTPPSVPPDISTMAGGAGNWTSLLLNKWFIGINGLAALSWLGLLARYAILGYANSKTGRLNALRKRHQDMLNNVRHAGPERFYELAMLFICARVGAAGDTFAATNKLEASSLPAPVKAGLLAVLEKYGESKFAAGSYVHPEVNERSDVLAVLNEFHKSYEN